MDGMQQEASEKLNTKIKDILQKSNNGS